MSKSLDELVKTLKPSQLSKTYQYLEYSAGIKGGRKGL